MKPKEIDIPIGHKLDPAGFTTTIVSLWKIIKRNNMHFVKPFDKIALFTYIDY